jgi:hypothetical protein
MRSHHGSVPLLLLIVMLPARPARAQWQSNGAPVCTAVHVQAYPAIVADGSGGAIIAWQDERANAGYDVYAQHVQAGGAVDPAWPSDGRALCTAAGDDDSPVLASDDAGGAVVAWYDGRGESYDIYASRVVAAGGLASVATSPTPGRFALGSPWPNPVRTGGVSIPVALEMR